jgi:hypothetical protein
MSIGTRFWLTRAGLGLLAGAAIGTLDFLYYIPLVPSKLSVGLLASSLAVWCGEYVLFALALGLAERLALPRELSAGQLTLAVAAAVAASVVLWHGFSVFVLRDQLGLQLFREHVTESSDWIGGIMYHAWLMLFFGGLIAAVYASQRWRTRMLEALRSAELGRAASEQRLAGAKLQFLQSRIDPDHLYDTLSRVERLYEHDAPAADELLDELIGFLRTSLMKGAA